MVKPRLLAIDDSATLRKLLEISFKDEKIELELAESGAEGQHKAETAPPDLILLDFVLPDMHAPEFVAWCAKHPKLADVPLLIMSAKGDDVRTRFMGEPMVIDFVPKPFTPKQIVWHVTNILDRRLRGEELGRLSRKRVHRVSSQQKEMIAHAIYARMRPQLTRLPQWVEQLGDNDPAPFLARKLLTPQVVDELLDVITPLLSVVPRDPKTTNSQLFQGQLGRLPLLTLLSMLAGEEQSGILTLTDEADQKLQIHLQWGNILCITCHDPKLYTRAAGVELPPVPAALWSHCEAEQRSRATPVYVTLCEAGVIPKHELPGLLARQGKRLLLEAVDSGTLRFVWREATQLPSYALDHGRPLFLGQVALELARKVVPPPAVEQRVLASDARFVRCPEFSKRVRPFELEDAERRTLAMADAQTPVLELALRARLEPREAVRVLLSLCRVGLLSEQPGDTNRDGPVLIADPDFDAFREDLVQALSRHSRPVALRELSAGEDICAAIADAKPRLLLINASLLREQAFKVAEARRASSGGKDLAMVAIVDGPQAELARELVSMGFDTVLMKPMLASDLERLLVA
jgi:DNA-binding response OmpR family regulator